MFTFNVTHQNPLCVFSSIQNPTLFTSMFTCSLLLPCLCWYVAAYFLHYTTLHLFGWRFMQYINFIKYAELLQVLHSQTIRDRERVVLLLLSLWAKVQSEQISFQPATDDVYICCCPHVERELVPPLWSQNSTILACYRHLLINEIAWNHLQECVSCHPHPHLDVCDLVGDPLMDKPLYSTTRGQKLHREPLINQLIQDKNMFFVTNPTPQKKFP